MRAAQLPLEDNSEETAQRVRGLFEPSSDPE
jgi:hypothetical protein